MNLDFHTLFLVTTYVEAILGILLLFVWAQNSSIMAVAYWGFSHLLRAGSITLFGLYGATSDRISIDLANVLLFVSFALIWTGARVFDGRPANVIGVCAGAVIWLVASRLPFVAESIELRVLGTSGIITTYIWLAAYEFWRGRGEALVSRWPTVFMLFAHGALFLLRTPLIRLLPWNPYDEVLDSVWLTVLSFEALLFTISIAFLLLAMAKERIEYSHRKAALVDPLTGIANRRALLEYGEELASRCAASGRPAAVLLMDLDHFKSVNDRFGHAIGDRALQIFANVATANVGRADRVGRLGGEEFAALLYDADLERALAVAERIRTAFAETAIEIEHKPVRGTTSIGVALWENGAFDLLGLLAQADQALYFAKERGRNRVEVASLDLLRRQVKTPPARQKSAIRTRDAA
jgi:diguanylate cyclase (GGDEF)-like protein